MGMIKCTECGKEISDKADVCVYCGIKLKIRPKICNECGNEIDIEKGVCPFCGCPIENDEAINKGEYIKKNNMHMKYIVGAIAGICILGISVKIINEKIVKPSQKYNVAMEMLENEKYDKAAEEFKKLNGFRDSEKKINECAYLKATEALENKNYDRAISEFETIVNYKDSKEKIDECYYKWGEYATSNNNLLEASTYFEKCLEYNDAEEKYNESLYNYAKYLVEEKYEYDKAIEYLSKIDYKNSEELIQRYERMNGSRFLDDKFYWYPAEYAIVLKQNLQNYDDSLSTSGREGDNGKYFIDILQNDDYTNTTVILDGVNEEEGYFNTMTISNTGITSDFTYPSIMCLALTRKDSTLDMSKEILGLLLDMEPSGSMSKDGLHYDFKIKNNTISIEIKSANIII